MKSTDDQGLIPVIVASEADSTYIRTIPTAQATTGDGSVSLDLGLPPECATAVAAGGKRPEMKDMNGIWNLFSRAIQSLQAYRGVYSASFAAAIGGYPKYALVSDGSGNFWVSTADANTTTPGATGANWQSLFSGYATEAWANKAFVKNAGGTNSGVVSATIDATTGQPSFQDGNGTWHIVQPYGSYATTVQLNNEITRATTVESNIQSAKYDKTGGNIGGTVTLTSGSGVYVAVDPGGQTTGGYTNYGELVSQAGGRGGSFGFYVQEQVGVAFNGVIFLTQSNSVARFLTMPGDSSSRVKDSDYGDLAYTSDLENYQPKGDYVPTSYVSSGTLNGGTYTKIGNVLRQSFLVQNLVHDNTGTWINFPISYSNTDNITVLITNNSNNDMDTFAYGWTTTGCYINIPYNSASSGNPVTVTVEGYAG